MRTERGLLGEMLDLAVELITGDERGARRLLAGRLVALGAFPALRRLGLPGALAALGTLVLGRLTRDDASRRPAEPTLFSLLVESTMAGLRRVTERRGRWGLRR
jgi:hypothetical protein